MRGTDEKGSQSTIKMEKGYYGMYPLGVSRNQTVAIHNKNGQGLLQMLTTKPQRTLKSRNPQ